MSTLDELRSTLKDRAAHAEPIGPATWNDGVRGKVRAMRRRRRAAGAAGVAAVLAVVAGVGLVPRPTGEPEGPQPAAGARPPATMTSLGYTYSWVESVDGVDGRATYDVGEDSGALLVSWATSGEDQRVRVRSDWSEGVTYRNGDFGDFVLVPRGSEGTVSARARAGQAGLAVYELSKAAPGLTRDGVTFRDEIADGRLAGAAFSEPGEAEVELTVTPSTGRIGVVYFCESLGELKGPRTLRVDSRGGWVAGGGACDRTDVDAAGQRQFSGRTEAGRPDTFTLTVRDGDSGRGEQVTDPDLRLGLGVYDLEPDRTRAPAQIEAVGHRWRLERLVRSKPGASLVETEVGGRELAQWVEVFGRGGRRNQTFEVIRDGRLLGSFSTPPASTGRRSVGPVGTRSTVGLRAFGGSSSSAVVMRIGVYVQDD